MTWLLLIGLIFMGVPIAEAIAARIKKGGVDLNAGEVQQALKLAEQRLAASETRIAALEEKVDFYEKLLSNPERAHGPTP
jgi:hypothetical protein